MAVRTTTTRNSAEAKLFWNGRSQAVRLPKEFRFEGDRVKVRHLGNGVFIEPVQPDQETAVDESLVRRGAVDSVPVGPEQRNGAELIAAMQASPFKEIDLEPARLRMPIRENQF